MKYRKVIDEEITSSDQDVSVAGAVNAVIAANVNERGSRTKVSRKQRVKVTQRDGRTEVHTSEDPPPSTS